MSTHLPHLRRPQAQVLALWSYGMALARAGGSTTITVLLAPGGRPSESTLRQRWREWCAAAADTRGGTRREVEVRACFASRLRWMVAWGATDARRRALARDATPLGQRFTVLASRVR